VFTSEQNAPFTRAGFAKMIATNKGHDTRALQAYLGHKNIQHTPTPSAGSGLPNPSRSP
jgi:type 1 fimbriae regulatory protein FimB/type 1 fimbriae regulatory protein FimE